MSLASKIAPFADLIQAAASSGLLFAQVKVDSMAEGIKGNDAVAKRMRFKSTARRLIGSDPCAARLVAASDLSAEITCAPQGGASCRATGTMESIALTKATEEALSFLADAFCEAGVKDPLGIAIGKMPTDDGDLGPWLRRQEAGPALRHLAVLGYPASKIKALKEQADDVTPSARLRKAP